MKNTLRTVITAMAAMCVAFTLFARGNSRWEDDARKRKANYIYGEAQRQNALDNKSALYELYKRAYELDSTNVDYYSTLGLCYVTMAHNNSRTLLAGKNLLRKKYEADPSDYVNAFYYSQLLGKGEEALDVLHTIDSLNPRRTDFALMYIDAILDNNDSLHINDALLRLRQLEVTAGKKMELTRRITSCYIMLDDTVSAVNEVKTAIAAAPLDASPYILASDFFEYKENPDSALFYLKKAADVEPANGGVAYALAQFYKGRGDTVNFSRQIDRALMETDLDISDKYEILLEYSRSLIDDSTYYAHVNSIFDHILSKNPQAVDIRSLYANYLSYQKNFAAAAENMELVVDLQPEEFKNWTAAAIYHVNNEEVEKGISTMLRAEKYHDSVADLHALISHMLYLKDDKANLPEAIREMQRAYDLTDSLDTGRRSEIMASIADYYSADDDKDTAKQCYVKALELNPDNTGAKNNYAYLLSDTTTDTDLLRQAESLSKETLTDDPGNPVYLDTYAWILFRLQDYRKAKEIIDSIFLNPQQDVDLSSDYYSHAGDIYYFNQLPDEALEYWKKALELDPDNELLQRKVRHKTYFHK